VNSSSSSIAAFEEHFWHDAYYFMGMPVGIDQQHLGRITVINDPSRDHVILRSEVPIVHAEVITVSGCTHDRMDVNGSTELIVKRPEGAGIWILWLRFGDGCSETVKVIGLR
jgi:hypothetical protein